MDDEVQGQCKVGDEVQDGEHKMVGEVQVLKREDDMALEQHKVDGEEYVEHEKESVGGEQYDVLYDVQRDDLLGVH